MLRCLPDLDQKKIMTKLAAILDQIDSGSALLPKFQRGYVWNRDQVRGLMRSLYRGYPVGGLLTWETQAPALPLTLSALRREPRRRPANHPERALPARAILR